MTIALPHTHTRKTVTIVLHGKASDNLSDAAFQLRVSESRLATEAIAHYLNYLEKTHQFRPSAFNGAGGFAFARK